MPLGVLIIGEVKELISEAVGKPTSPQPFGVRDEMCSSEVNGGEPEARRSMPGQIEARRKLGGGSNRC
jgi:hypothetical protein